MAGLFGKKQTISSTQTKLGALRIQNASQGLPVPIVFGNTRIVPNLLWYGDFTAIPHTTTTKQGGKGGGGTTTSNTSYTYTCAAVFGLCEGPVSGPVFVGTVWANKKVTDTTHLGLTSFQGDYAQAPWTYLTTNHANQALSYRGTCYVAAAAFDLGTSDGLPNLSFEIRGLLGTTDQNPADIVNAMLTNDKYGAGWPSAQLGSLTDFNAYCAAAGFVISPAYVAQAPMSQILTELVQVGNSEIVWSGDGLLKIVPYADTVVGSYTPNLTIQYNLGPDDFLGPAGHDPVKVDRKRQADAHNTVRIEFLDRSNQFNLAIAEAKDQLAIDLYGIRPMAPISAHAICDSAVARKVAQAILQRALYVRNVYTFTVGWRYGRLEPMDIVTLTDSNLGLAAQAVRIQSIEENENGELLMTAEELNIGVSSPGVYSTQTSNGATPQNNVPPGNAVAPVMFQPPLALTGDPQVWIGSAGGVNWGGAEVWASSDNTTFSRVGALTGPARFGVLAANLALVADPDTTSTLAVDLSTSNGVLVAASNSVADAGGTLSYIAGANAIAGELVGYSNVVLTAPHTFNLGTYLRRARAGTAAAAHLSGVNVMRLDDAVGAFGVSPALFGSTIFVKLLSYNTTGGALQQLSDVSSYSLALQTQVVTTGSGYPYYADRSSTANTPAAGNLRFNNAAQASATHVYFNQLTAQGANMATFFASVGSTGFLDLRDSADTNKWATFQITSSNVSGSVQDFGISYRAGGAEIPNGDTVEATFSPTIPTGVTSVGLALPASLFSVANSPVTSAGTLNATLNTQNAATFFAGPLTGNAAAPTFRAFALTDLPTANVTAGQVPTFNGSAVVWANLGGGANQSAATVFAGPASGNAAAPAFRALAGGDMPKLTINTQTANYTAALSDANVSWVEMNSANNTVFTVPSNANVPFANGSVILVNRFGAGNVTITPQANVTVHNSSSNTIRAQYSTVGLTKRGTDEWTLFGDTT